MRKSVFSLVLALGLFAVSTGSALAGPQRPDLRVQMTGPSSVMVYTGGTYTVNVKNIGNAHAQNVLVRVQLPVTNTSPSVSILGTLSGLDSHCTVVSNELRCSYSSLNKNQTLAFSFTFMYPVTTKPLVVTAIGSTPNETELGNNTATLTPAMLYGSLSLTSGTVLNSHCTGTNLTSYFECELFPSSISSHTTEFNADHTIAITGEPSFSGTWNQATSSQLSFTYYQTNGTGTTLVASFAGYKSKLQCFEGITTFPGSTYVSPYKVCLQ
jgi:hypothetical protein